MVYEVAVSTVIKYYYAGDVRVAVRTGGTLAYLIEREGTSCENLPETHAYLKRLRAFVDGYAPGTMLLSEANQWPEDVRPYFGGDPDEPTEPGDEFHMNFHFPVMPRIYMALARQDRTPIHEILAATPALPPGCQWATFLRCHDELTLEMVTPAEREELWSLYAPEPRMRSNLGIRRRLAPLLGNDRPCIELANSILFSLPGSPVIYYGDEIGMGDNIFLEDRRGLRTPMQWQDTRSAGFSEADPSELYFPLIMDETYGYHKVNVTDERADPDSLLNRMRLMLTVRKANPAFGRGDFTLLFPDNTHILACLRSYGGVTLLSVNNLATEAQSCELDLSQFAGATPVDLFTGERLSGVTEGGWSLSLPPSGYRWLRLAPEAG